MDEICDDVLDVHQKSPSEKKFVKLPGTHPLWCSSYYTHTLLMHLFIKQCSTKVLLRGIDCSFQNIHFRRSHQRCSMKKAVLKIFEIFKGKHLCWSLFLIKLLGLQLCWKETPTKVLSGEHWQNFKNAYFEEHLRTTAFFMSTSDQLLM